MPSPEPRTVAARRLGRVEGHDALADRRRLGGRVLRARRARRPGGARRPRLDAGDRARHRGRGAARRRPLAPGRPDRPRRRGLVVPRPRFEAEPAAGRARRSSLGLDGIATVAEVFLNGERLLESESMFAAHEVDVGAPAARRRQRAGDPLPGAGAAAGGAAQAARPLAHQAGRRRACASSARCCSAARRASRRGPPAVGPWRPVWLERRRAARGRRASALRPRLDGEDGVLVGAASRCAALDGAAPAEAEVELSGPSGSHRGVAAAAERAGATSPARRRAARPRRRPLVAAHPRRAGAARGPADGAGAAAARSTVDAGRVGFRELVAGAAPATTSRPTACDLHVNGVRGLRPRRRLDPGRPGRPGPGAGASCARRWSRSATPA